MADIKTDFNKEDYLRPGSNKNPDEIAIGSLGYILQDIKDIKNSYIRLGFHLYEFNRLHLYTQFDYYSLEEFAEAKLGLDKSAVSRCLGVFREFSNAQYTYYEGPLANIDSYGLASEWKDFSYSQLCEMLPLDVLQRKEIKPDMTVKDIREFKKSKKHDSSTVATSQQDKDKRLTPDFMIYSGIILKNKIKNALVIDTVYLSIYDKSGNYVRDEYCNVWMDLLMNKDGHIVLRLHKDIPCNGETQP